MSLAARSPQKKTIAPKRRHAPLSAVSLPAPSPRGAAKRQAPDPAVLLAWYDRHRRRLPWRAEPGKRADPYAVWLSEIMLQQTTVKAVAPYYARFLQRWPDVRALAAAALDDVLKSWAGLGYYARARNLHACAKVVAAEHRGLFPREEEALRALPGIGDYTAAAIAAIAFGRRAAPVDGNIERVIARLHAVEQPLPAAKPLIRELARSLTPHERPGDFAQAMMDLGATICTPKRPACTLCPWTGDCAARERGDPETLPRKAPKAEGRLRRGAAFVLLRADDRILVRTRPAKGLLGGMTEFPGTEWSPGFKEKEALAAAAQWYDKTAWRRLPGKVVHTFTHFPLELTVYMARSGPRTRAPSGTRWVKLSEISSEALPSVMRKILTHSVNGTAIKGR